MNRQQDIYNSFNRGYFQVEQDKKVTDDIKMQIDEVRRQHQSVLDHQKSVKMMKNAQSMLKNQLDVQLQEKHDYERLFKQKKQLLANPRYGNNNRYQE